MYQKGLLRGFQDVKLIGIFSTEPNLIHTKQPLKSLADVRGTKLRAAGPVYGSVVKHLGAIPIGMRVTQVTESINRGVVHGTLLGWGGTLIFSRPQRDQLSLLGAIGHHPAGRRHE